MSSVLNADSPPIELPASNTRPSPWGVWDWVCIGLLLAAYQVYLSKIDPSNWPLHYDAFRDLASMENLRAGFWWRDPVLLGKPPWYPPLFTWVHGSLATLLDIEPYKFTSISRFWFNCWIPAAMFILLRNSVSRIAALAGPVILVVTSAWWSRHLTVAMPSIQSVLLVLIGLHAWHRSRLAKQPCWTPGLMVSLALWTHPVASIMLVGSMTIDSVLTSCCTSATDRKRILRQLIVAGAIAAVLASPVLINQLRLPRLNPEPRTYFGLELYMPKYAFQFHALPAPLFGLAGAGLILSRRPELRWIVAYIIVGSVGQILGYIGEAAGHQSLLFVPHQFQWHTQIALTLSVVVFLDWIVPRAMANRPLRIKGWILLGFIASLSVGIPNQPGQTSSVLGAARLYRKHENLIEWIRAQTNIDDVFVAEPSVAYFTVSAYTGRKCLLSFPAHINPAADVPARESAQAKLLSSTDPVTLRKIIDQFSVNYLVLDEGDVWKGKHPICEQSDLVQLVFHDKDSGYQVYGVIDGDP